MEEKINLKAVEDYSKAYALLLTDTFFSKKEKISGPEILRFCEVQQVNLFVVRELLMAWKQEAQKYKSPYFNYDDPQVKAAFTQFQNVLSNHIAIARNHFLPLLQKGVSLTIYLVLDPYDFYSDMLDSHGKEMLNVAELANDIKYLKINRSPLEKLTQKLLAKKKDIVPGNEAFALLDQLLEEVNFTPEDVDPYIQQLSRVLPLSINKLFEVAKSEAPENLQSKKIEKGNVPVSAFAQRETTTTVADGFQMTAQLKDRLTINQKFMFTKMLFNGDFDSFSKAINHLDSLSTLDQATSHLDAHYPQWDRETEEYEEFIELVTKRFS